MQHQTARALRHGERPHWQRALAEGVREPRHLIEQLGLDPALLPAARSAGKLFPLRVPRAYIARMRYGDPDDPLLRQVLPLDAEQAQIPGFTDDPVGDRDVLQPGGVLHKYHGRALLIASGACAVNCRYCFRRHFPYSEANARRGQWQGALDYLAARGDLREVILSGGDPLTLGDERLGELATRLADIPHLRRLRVHSRLPIVMPERVTEALTAWLAGTRLTPVMVLHANHPNELDGDVAEATARLRRAGVMLLNQAVLLNGVNDAVSTLSRLGEKLFDIGVLPYYLHLLDPVKGAAHFEVGEARAAALMRELAASEPGYLVPELVRELPGRPAKTRVAWERDGGASGPDARLPQP